MKPAIALALLFLAACASPTDVIDQRSFRCEPGQDIEIRAGLFDPAATREAPGPLVYKVEVANNSSDEVTVKSIRLAPLNDQSTDMKNQVSKTYDQVIPPGKDHLFEIPINDSWRSPEFAQRTQQRVFEFSATVALSNGDSYRCEFASTWN